MPAFRKAAITDLDAIMDVVHEAQAFMATLGIDQWQDGYPSRELIETDIQLGRAYVAEHEGVAHAISILTGEPEPIYDSIDGKWIADGPYLTMHRTALSDKLRHTGAAALILENAVRMAKEMNLVSVRADTHRGNKAMRRFLEKNGFVLCGEVVYEVDAGDPIRVAYELVL